MVVCADCPARLARDLEAGFAEFVVHHQDLVFGIAMRLTHDADESADLSQDTFVRAYKALVGYPPARRRELRPRGWLAAIVTNLGRNRVRRVRSRPAGAALDDIADQLPDGRPGPERVLAQREAAQAWRMRLTALPPRYGMAVALRHVSGLSYPELAEALGRPVNTVKSDVHRGLAMLRADLLRESGAGPSSPVARRATLDTR